MRNIADGLGRMGHDVHYVGWQTFGQPMKATFHDKILNFTCLPNVGGAKFGEKALPYWLSRIEPDCVFTLADFWMIAWMWRSEYPTPWICYFPIDGYPIPDDVRSMLGRVDVRVCYSKYAKKLVNEIGLSVNMIPHGVNTQNFFPLSELDRMQARRDYGIPQDAYVVNCVTRNQSRKILPRLLKAFILFHKQYPKSVLYWHCDRRDREGWDLTYLHKRFGLQEGRDVFFTPASKMRDFMTGVSEGELNRIYNLANPGLHIIPSGGEGAGLPWIESQASGVVNIAPNYTTAQEWFSDGYDSGVLVPIDDFWNEVYPKVKNSKVEDFLHLVDEDDMVTGGAGVDRCQVKVGKLYEAMKNLYENPSLTEKLRENALRRAKEYDWETRIVPLFDKLLRETVTEFK